MKLNNKIDNYYVNNMSASFIKHHSQNTSNLKLYIRNKYSQKLYYNSNIKP